jgi:hypothetical protein
MNDKLTKIDSTIYSIKINKSDLVFMASVLPYIPDNEDLGKVAMFTGEYLNVSLLNYTQKSYIIRFDSIPLGYEYIMEKYELEEEVASALTIAICNLIGRESKVPEVYENKYRFALNRFKKLM